jgi:hypothetical protein
MPEKTETSDSEATQVWNSQLPSMDGKSWYHY